MTNIDPAIVEALVGIRCECGHVMGKHTSEGCRRVACPCAVPWMHTVAPFISLAKAEAWDESARFIIHQAELTTPEHALERADRFNRFNPYRDGTP